MPHPLRVVQDGNRFYTDDGELLYTAPTHVSDYDLVAAQQAREELLNWLAAHLGYHEEEITFV